MADPTPVGLRRTLGLRRLTLYGLGTIVGGGFYALIGKVAVQAGPWTPVAFLTAAAVASLSALSFGELCARLPHAAGEASYVRTAFGREWLSALVGWAVIATGIVSAATLATAFAGFLDTLVDVPEPAVVIALVIALGLVAAWGIGESVALAVFITFVEVGGLVLVLVLAGGEVSDFGARFDEARVSGATFGVQGILLGAFVSFYSFVGFEDMVNLAEEVKRPARDLPRAILFALGATTLIYAAVCTVVVAAVPQAELAASTTPLSDAVRGTSPTAASALVLVGMLAGVNGALVQIVMASRVAYGLASRGQAPRVFARVHPRTQTPLEATAFAAMVVLLLALFFPLLTLAKITSAVLLGVYALVNLALYRIKGRDGPPPDEGPNHPRWVPAAGFAVCVGFLAVEAWSLL